VGLGYRVLNDPLSDSPQYATTATTTVADVAGPSHDVAHRVHQTDFLGLVEDGQGFLLGNVFWAGRSLTRGEGKADF
jgi:hypothetical protein